MRITGTVKFFNVSKGFGFVQPENGTKDVFVHASALEVAGIRSLNEGGKVSFVLEDDRRGRGKSLGSPTFHSRDKRVSAPSRVLSLRPREVRWPVIIQGRRDRHAQTEPLERFGRAQECNIVRLLPIEEGNYLFRIKCDIENVDRVVKECELVLRGTRNDVALSHRASLNRGSRQKASK
jgi:CspA family cold shock protein